MFDCFVIFTTRHPKDDRRLYFQSVHISGGVLVSDFQGGVSRSQILGRVPGFRFSGGVPGLRFLGGGGHGLRFSGWEYLVSNIQRGVPVSDFWGGTQSQIFGRGTWSQ